MRNVIVIGLNPTKLSVPRKGGAVSRFREWLDYLGIDKVAFTNLSSDPHWDKKNVDYDFLCSSISGHDKVVAWGPTVSKYLTDINISHFTLPHPSPLNRQVNDHKFIRQKLDECKEFLNE
jgi:hypothetical protein